jgi:hypothetical protein
MRTTNMVDTEDLVWMNTDPEDLWVLDKLIISRYLGYVCGPVGLDVPAPGWYIVRPCVNALGLGLGAQRVWLEEDTCHLPPGHFWCEWLEGDHISVDYDYGKQVLAVQGFKNESTFTQWDKWIRVNTKIVMPSFLSPIKIKYRSMNCEYIGGKLIEVHLRGNPDFPGNRQEYIPVWKGDNTTPPVGYTYVEDPDLHGRIGAWVK